MIHNVDKRSFFLVYVVEYVHEFDMLYPGDEYNLKILQKFSFEMNLKRNFFPIVSVLLDLQIFF